MEPKCSLGNGACWPLFDQQMSELKQLLKTAHLGGGKYETARILPMEKNTIKVYLEKLSLLLRMWMGYFQSIIPSWKQSSITVISHNPAGGLNNWKQGWIITWKSKNGNTLPLNHCGKNTAGNLPGRTYLSGILKSYDFFIWPLHFLRYSRIW